MKILLSILLLLTISCASQKEDKSSPSNMAGKIFDFWKEIRGKVGETTSEEIRIARQKLNSPVRIGVYFVKPPSDKWAWTEADKKVLIEKLRGTKGIREVQELYGMTASESSPRELRERAAQQGLETLLIVQGKSDTDSSLNAGALSYIALFPAFFVKGNNVKSDFAVEAILWDVRTSYIHTGAKSVGSWKMKRPLFFPQKNRAIRKSRTESLQELATELSSNLKKLL